MVHIWCRVLEPVGCRHGVWNAPKYSIVVSTSSRAKIGSFIFLSSVHGFFQGKTNIFGTVEATGPNRLQNMGQFYTIHRTSTYSVARTGWASLASLDGWSFFGPLPWAYAGLHVSTR